MNFREQFPTNTPKGVQEFIPPHVEEAWNKTRKIFVRDAIDMDGFEDLYGKENIERDKQKIARYQESFEMTANTAYAEILEGILYEQIELSDWFGKNATTIKTSKFDDIVHGTDLVVEFKDPTLQAVSHMALAVDVTFGTMSMEKKFQKIRVEIEKGTLGTIKYFQSESRYMRGELKKVPRVVIGLEKKQVIELSRVWNGGQVKDLAEHPAQKLFLKEILLELEGFKLYAEQAERPEIVAIYAQEIAKIKPLLSEKGNIRLGSLEGDKVYLAIQNALKI